MIIFFFYREKRWKRADKTSGARVGDPYLWWRNMTMTSEKKLYICTIRICICDCVCRVAAAYLIFVCTYIWKRRGPTTTATAPKIFHKNVQWRRYICEIYYTHLYILRIVSQLFGYEFCFVFIYMRWTLIIFLANYYDRIFCR